MNIYQRFKRWLAAAMNIVEHEIKQDLQFESINAASDKFATAQSRRFYELTNRLNAAEALGRFQAAKLDNQAIDLAAALKQLKTATDALASHDARVRQMEALTMRKAGLLPRRS